MTTITQSISFPINNINLFSFNLIYICLNFNKTVNYNSVNTANSNNTSNITDQYSNIIYGTVFNIEITSYGFLIDKSISNEKISPVFYDLNSIYFNSSIKIKIFNFSQTDKKVNVKINFLTEFGKELFDEEFFSYEVKTIKPSRADLSLASKVNIIY